MSLWLLSMQTALPKNTRQLPSSQSPGCSYCCSSCCDSVLLPGAGPHPLQRCLIAFHCQLRLGLAVLHLLSLQRLLCSRQLQLQLRQSLCAYTAHRPQGTGRRFSRDPWNSIQALKRPFQPLPTPSTCVNAIKCVVAALLNPVTRCSHPALALPCLTSCWWLPAYRLCCAAPAQGCDSDARALSCLLTQHLACIASATVTWQHI